MDDYYVIYLSGGRVDNPPNVIRITGATSFKEAARRRAAMLFTGSIVRTDDRLLVVGPAGPSGVAAEGQVFDLVRLRGWGVRSTTHDA